MPRNDRLSHRRRRCPPQFRIAHIALTRTSRRVSRFAFMAASLGVSFLNQFILMEDLLYTKSIKFWYTAAVDEKDNHSLWVRLSKCDRKIDQGLNNFFKKLFVEMDRQIGFILCSSRRTRIYLFVKQTHDAGAVTVVILVRAWFARRDVGIKVAKGVVVWG